MAMDTRETILSTAEHLIRKKGYNGFSYRDIASKVGIRKASIHYHFETKPLLGVAAIQRYRSKVEYLMDKLIRVEKDPVTRLEGFFNFFRDAQKKDHFCPAAVLSVEYHTVPEEIRMEVRGLFNKYISWLAKILEDGRNRGAFHFGGQSSEKAAMVAASIEGALMLSRTIGASFFEQVVSQIRNELVVTL